MKTLLSIVLTVCLLAGTAWAGSDDWWQGALIGGALGAIVGHNSHDIDTAVAIPAFAAAGALIGYGNDRGWFDYDDHYGYHDWHRPYRYYDRHDRYGRYDRFPRYHPRGYGQYYYRPPVYSRRPSRRSQDVRRPKVRQPVAPPPDLHPGVDVIKIPITLASGLSLDLRILRVNDRFIGPQGEEYASLPTSEELAAKYRP